MSWTNYADKVRRYFEFSMNEWQQFAILVIAFAFMFSFTQWGTASFDAEEGLKNFLIAFVLVSVSVFVHHAAQRLLGVHYGYRIEHRIWWIGLFVGLLTLLLTNGRVMLFAASALQAHFLPVHRLGKMRYGPSLRQIGMVALIGPMAAVVFAFLLHYLWPIPTFSKLLMFNLLFAGYQMLPIPPLDGVHVFVGAKTSTGGGFTYAFTVAAFLAFFLLYFSAGLSLLWSIVLAVIVGVVGALAFDAVVGK